MAHPDDHDQAQPLDPHEQWIVGVLAEARQRDRAPSELRGLIDDRRLAGRRPRRLGLMIGSGRAAWLAGASVALAALILVLAFTLPVGVPAAPSVSQAAALAARGPARPAPRPDPANPAALRVRVGGLAFPSWSSRPGTTAAGARTDHLDGRTVQTVFYTVSGRQVAYSIVGSPPLPVASRVTIASGGYWFHVLQRGGRTVVTWTEQGHTCILSGAGMLSTRLVRLVTG